MRGALPWRVGPANRAVGERARSLPRLAVRGDAAADHGRGGEILFRGLRRPLADGRGPCRRPRSRGDEGVGRPRLLQPRPQPQGCADAVAALRRPFPDTRPPGSRRFPASAPTRRRRSRRSPSTSAAAVVDGNVERVIARLFAIETPLPDAKPEIRARQAALTPGDARRRLRAGDDGSRRHASARRSGPPARSARCPTAAPPIGLACRKACRGKAAKGERPVRVGAAFVAVRADGAILLRRRPPRGLLGGMTEVPTGAWRAAGSGGSDEVPFAAAWRPVAGPVIHVFTHFRLELAVHRAAVPQTFAPPADHWWSLPADLPNEALPTGIYHRLLWAYCSRKNLQLHIGNAAHIKWSFGIARGKSDKIDSQRLCYYAFKESDMLKSTPALDPVITTVKGFNDG